MNIVKGFTVYFIIFVKHPQLLLRLLLEEIKFLSDFLTGSPTVLANMSNMSDEFLFWTEIIANRKETHSDVLSRNFGDSWEMNYHFLDAFHFHYKLIIGGKHTVIIFEKG